MEGRDGWLPAALADLLGRPTDGLTVVLGCRLALEATRLEDLRASQALQALAENRSDSDWAEQMRLLSDQLDDLASAALENEGRRAYLELFSRARAASALAFAHAGSEADSLYEAAHACGDLDGFIARLHSERASR